MFHRTARLSREALQRNISRWGNSLRKHVENNQSIRFFSSRNSVDAKSTVQHQTAAQKDTMDQPTMHKRPCMTIQSNCTRRQLYKRGPRSAAIRSKKARYISLNREQQGESVHRRCIWYIFCGARLLSIHVFSKDTAMDSNKYNNEATPCRTLSNVQDTEQDALTFLNPGGQLPRS